MKICRKCGVEIINGENGCMLMGDICFDCGGHPSRKIVPAKNHWETDDDYEAAILTRQEDYND